MKNWVEEPRPKLAGSEISGRFWGGLGFRVYGLHELYETLPVWGFFTRISLYKPLKQASSFGSRYTGSWLRSRQAFDGYSCSTLPGEYRVFWDLFYREAGYPRKGAGYDPKP